MTYDIQTLLRLTPEQVTAQWKAAIKNAVAMGGTTWTIEEFKPYLETVDPTTVELPQPASKQKPLDADKLLDPADRAKGNRIRLMQAEYRCYTTTELMALPVWEASTTNGNLRVSTLKQPLEPKKKRRTPKDIVRMASMIRRKNPDMKALSTKEILTHPDFSRFNSQGIFDGRTNRRKGEA